MKLKDEIREWDRRIGYLRKKAGQVKSQSQIEFDRQIDLLDAKLDQLRGYLKEASYPSQKRREDMDVLIERALSELDDAYDSAISKID